MTQNHVVSLYIILVYLYSVCFVRYTGKCGFSHYGLWGIFAIETGDWLGQQTVAWTTCKVWSNTLLLLFSSLLFSIRFWPDHVSALSPTLFTGIAIPSDWLYSCSTKMREVLGNPSPLPYFPRPKRFPEGKARGKSQCLREIRDIFGDRGFCTPWPCVLPHQHWTVNCMFIALGWVLNLLQGKDWKILSLVIGFSNTLPPER